MSTYETLNVVTLLGSLRKGSFNGMVVHMLPKVALAEMEVSPLPYPAEKGFSASVEALAEQIRTPMVSSFWNITIPFRAT